MKKITLFNQDIDVTNDRREGCVCFMALGLNCRVLYNNQLINGIDVVSVNLTVNKRFSFSCDFTFDFLSYSNNTSDKVLLQGLFKPKLVKAIIEDINKKSPIN